MVLAAASPAGGAEPRPCARAAVVESLRIVVERPGQAHPLPLGRVNQLRRGDRLRYAPARADAENTKGRIALIAVRSGREAGEGLEVLDAQPVSAPATWTAPFDTSVVAVVFGPRGLDTKRVNTLVESHEQLIDQLTEYAEQTAQIGGLVDTLMAWEQSGGDHGSLDAMLRGFSAQYGLAVPRLDTAAAPDAQAAALLRALLPSLARYDPLATDPTARVQQSAGLAATVASLFFGSPVTLAAGGAALFQNLRTLISPDTEFRSAFAQFRAGDVVVLCAKPQAQRARTRPAYLWALGIPDTGAPELAVGSPAHLPLGCKSALRLTGRDAAQLKRVPRVQAWRLVSPAGDVAGGAAVALAPGATDTLELDLTRVAAAGDYRLRGEWDWDAFEVAGGVTVHPLGDLGGAHLTAASEDRLIQGAGRVALEVEGADFQFVEGVVLASVEGPVSCDLRHRLPLGKAGGEQRRLEVTLDTDALRSGSYRLELTQVAGRKRALPIRVHPPLPVLEGLPLRVNLGETTQTLRLRGAGLDRLAGLASPAALWDLGAAQGGRERSAAVRLEPGATRGDRLPLALTVSGLHEPVALGGAVEIAGPRPRVSTVEKSLPAHLGVDLRADEIPAGVPVSVALRARELGPRPTLELACGGRSEAVLALRPGESRAGARLDLTGAETLFLSLDPGAVGAADCELAATLVTEAGASDPARLGRVVLVPEIERFELSDERLGGALYAGTLTGRGLQAIEKVGWDAEHGHPVSGIPTPLAGTGLQSLRIALPWPSPTPRAPVFVWLRGEPHGRIARLRGAR
jgi:hypothetical protein